MIQAVMALTNCMLPSLKQHTRLQALDSSIKVLSKNGMLQKPAWEAAAAEVRQLISGQLLPLLGQIQTAAGELHDHMAREQLALSQIALQQLPRQLAQGEAFIGACSMQVIMSRAACLTAV